MDELDKRIISEMLRDSSRSLRSIARGLGIPVTTLHERVRKLKSRGIIRRFTLELNPEKLDLDVTIIVLVRVEGPYIREVEGELSKHPNVVALYDVTGEYDVVVIAKFKNMKEVDGFIKGLLRDRRIQRTVTSVALNTVKEYYCPRELPLLP